MKQLISMSHNQTMTSKELVEVINTIRKEEGNDVEIQHDKLKSLTISATLRCGFKSNTHKPD